MTSIMQILHIIISFYMWLLIGAAIFSWLQAFNVINARNAFVAQIGDLCRRLTEPALRPLRRFVPTVNGVDLSFLALYFLLLFVRILIQNNFPVW